MDLPAQRQDGNYPTVLETTFFFFRFLHVKAVENMNNQPFSLENDSTIRPTVMEIKIQSHQNLDKIRTGKS